LTPHLHNISTSNSTSNIKKENNNKEVAISAATLIRSLSTSNNYNYDNNAKPLSISIQSSQNIVNGRGTSTVTAIAYDATTDKKIDNAVVKVKITFSSNDTSKEIVGHNGEVTYSAEIQKITAISILGPQYRHLHLVIYPPQRHPRTHPHLLH
jgi:proteasome assembly chaperone (PAC2) family protein